MSVSLFGETVAPWLVLWLSSFDHCVAFPIFWMVPLTPFIPSSMTSHSFARASMPLHPTFARWHCTRPSLFISEAGEADALKTSVRPSTEQTMGDGRVGGVVALVVSCCWSW